MDNKIELKENLVIMDDGQFSLWTKRQYEIYISKALEVGACPAVKLITHFDEKDDLLAALQPSTLPLIGFMNVITVMVVAGTKAVKHL